MKHFKKLNSVTISCDIRLAPKQTVDQYELSSLYGQCDIPSRSSRKRRSEPEDEDLSKITITKAINISSKKTNEKSNSFPNHCSFSVALIVIAMFLLWLLFKIVKTSTPNQTWTNSIYKYNWFLRTKKSYFQQWILEDYCPILQ